MKIVILTGGGDVPGLNPCIKAVVNRAIDAGHEVMGIRRGWGGLLNFDFDDPESLRLKAQYVRMNGLGGVMIWELSQDDERSSLVHALANGGAAVLK